MDLNPGINYMNEMINSEMSDNPLTLGVGVEDSNEQVCADGMYKQFIRRIITAQNQYIFFTH